MTVYVIWTFDKVETLLTWFYGDGAIIIATIGSILAVGFEVVVAVLVGLVVVVVDVWEVVVGTAVGLMVVVVVDVVWNVVVVVDGGLVVVVVVVL